MFNVYCLEAMYSLASELPRARCVADESAASESNRATADSDCERLSCDAVLRCAWTDGSASTGPITCSVSLAACYADCVFAAECSPCAGAC